MSDRVRRVIDAHEAHLATGKELELAIKALEANEVTQLLETTLHPKSADGSSAFAGIDRGEDPSRLAGARLEAAPQHEHDMRWSEAARAYMCHCGFWKPYLERL